MFKTISDLHPRDGDYPARTFKLQMRRRVLDGTLYDVLPYPFWMAVNDANEPITLSQRQPSVRYNLCRLVSLDAVSLLFSEGRFPAVDCDDERTRDILAKVVKECRLQGFMGDVALSGSIGSACVLMQVLRGRLFFRKLRPEYLTPEWNPEAPDELLRVTDKYKVRGDALKSQGYAIAEQDLMVNHWFQRQWTTDQEIWFVPWTKAQESKPDFAPQIDETRTVNHDLGFCPCIWIRNLASDDEIDGACTFEQAIDSQIEVEYQLSQGGKGLKYSSSPELVIREPAMDGDILKGHGQAIVVNENGDAKLLELHGGAIDAIAGFVRLVRELALEAIRGNRSSADKLSVAQSGKALELMHQPLVWLANELRASYGQAGLLPLLQMVVKASEKIAITVAGEEIGTLDGKGLDLRWPPMFSPTAHDQVETVTALRTARDGGLLSQETGTRILAEMYDLPDATGELVRIAADEAKALAAAENAGAQIQVRESGDAAAMGSGNASAE